MTGWKRFVLHLADEEAASAIEYAFLASLIALVIITAVTAIGVSLTEVFVNVREGF